MVTFWIQNSKIDFLWKTSKWFFDSSKGKTPITRPLPSECSTTDVSPKTLLSVVFWPSFLSLVKLIAMYFLSNCFLLEFGISFWFTNTWLSVWIFFSYPNINERFGLKEVSMNVRTVVLWTEFREELKSWLLFRFLYSIIESFFW